MTPYSTFWRRFFAGIIDVFALAIPIGVLTMVFRIESRGDGSNMAWNLAQSVIMILYSVLMHTAYGQTLGKMATGVIVLDKTETRTPALKEAILRDIGDIAPTAIVIGFVLTAYLSGDYDLAPSRYREFTNVLGRFTGLWFLIEIVTMLTNSRRRALHDYIAGTVVMRKDSVPVGVLDTVASRPLEPTS